MPLTISRYDHTLEKIAWVGVDNMTLRVMLLDNTVSFDQEHTTLAEVVGSPSAEVSGAGWASGGETLSGVSVTAVAHDGESPAVTNDVMIDADDISVAISGTLDTFRYAAIYDDDDPDDAPLWHLDFGTDVTRDSGQNVAITFNANGIQRIHDPA